MAKIISTMATKGGAGKTTIAILVAGELLTRGKSVTLIDADPNGNLSDWWNKSRENGNEPSGVSFTTALTNTAIAERLREASRSDFVIIDTRGVISGELQAAIGHSDICVVPVQTNEDEILSLSRITELVLLENQRRTSGKAEILAVVTRINVISRRSVEYETIHELTGEMGTMGVPIRLSRTELYERQPYRNIRRGLGFLQQLDVDESIAKARTEVESLVDQVLETVGV